MLHHNPDKPQSKVFNYWKMMNVSPYNLFATKRTKIIAKVTGSFGQVNTLHSFMKIL